MSVSVFICFTETPLTLAVQGSLSVEGIRVLVLNGAHVDFRSRDGLTPLHKAVRAHNQPALMVQTHAVHLDHEQLNAINQFISIMFHIKLNLMVTTAKY